MRILFLLIVLTFSCATSFSQERDSVAVKTEELEGALELSKKTYNKDFKQEAFNEKIYEGLSKSGSLKSSEKSLEQDTNSLKLEVQDAIMRDVGKEGTDRAAIVDTKKKKSLRLSGPSQYDSRIEPLQLDQNIDWQKQMLLKAESVGIIVERE